MNWYVCYTEKNATIERERDPDCELPPQTVMERLDAAGIEVFYPKVRITREKYDRKRRAPVRETVWIPAYGRYLFAMGNPDVIRGTRGVMFLLREESTGQWGTVPQAVIDDLRSRYRDYRAIIKMQELALKPGQVVKLIDGPYRTYQAEVESVRNLTQGLFDALIPMFGTKVRAQVPVEHVEGFWRAS